MTCPHCESTATHRRKRRTALGYRRFSCASCQRRFNERTGTPFNELQFPTDIVLLAVLWRLRYKLGLRDVAELLLQRGYDVSYETIRAWEFRFTPLISADLRARRRGRGGRSSYLDETYMKVSGRVPSALRARDPSGVRCVPPSACSQIRSEAVSRLASGRTRGRAPSSDRAPVVDHMRPPTCAENGGLRHLVQPVLAASAVIALAMALVSCGGAPPPVTERAATAPDSGMSSATATPQVAGAALGRLNWGTNADGSRRTDAELAALARSQGATDLGRQTRRVLEVAEQRLGNPVAVVATIQREGILSTDPRYRASDAALKSIDDIYTWAMCARVADVTLAGRCAQRAGESLDSWSSTYRSMGNPINDNYLIPMIQAVDLACPIASSERCARWRTWVLDLASRGDDFYAAVKPADGRFANNWASWRLLIRGTAGAVAGDEALVASTRQLVAAHVARNRRSDGSSIDFSERDALHYHVYDVEPLTELVLFVPSAVDATTAEAIASGVMFLRPFALGEQTHIEFARTTVAFDIQRKQAGDPVFANMSWNPKEARQLLRLARTRFPAVRPWTESLVDENYSPRIKQLAALLEP